MNPINLAFKGFGLLIEHDVNTVEIALNNSILLKHHKSPVKINANINIRDKK